MKTVLSVDVAKCKSMFMLMSSDGEILIDSIEVNHNFEGFEKIRKQLEIFDVSDLTVFMESTGIYHLPVERYFKENDIRCRLEHGLERATESERRATPL